VTQKARRSVLRSAGLVASAVAWACAISACGSAGADDAGAADDTDGVIIDMPAASADVVGLIMCEPPQYGEVSAS
jgi:hypothetical protein